MPRILRIINRFNLGGPTHNAAYLTRYLPGDYETLLVGGSQEATEEGSHHILRSLGVEAMILPELQREVAPWRDRGAYRRIKQLIREFKPDIVHTHAAKAGAVGRMAAADLGVKAIVHTFHGHVFHSYFGPVRTALYKNIERFLARRSSRIIAISEKQKHELVDEHRICPGDKVSVIPLGFDLSRFREDRAQKRAFFRSVYGVADDEIAIAIVGRLVPIKNHDLFLEAMAAVARRTQRRVRAFIVGDGEERDHLEARVKELGLSHAVGPIFNGHGFGHGAGSGAVVPQATITFTSWIKEVDIVYAGVDLVVLTSLNEGTPVSLIEAQASDRPVVTTRVGGVENVVLPDRSALLSPSGDLATMTEAILRVVEDDALRGRMGGQGWDFVRQRYHYTRLVDDTARLYDALLN
ncbi:MAG: glycosyltransferase [Flavobacteriales bacterium]|jgi:glycosyltransferase involved in cell wall biosynthesis|nr:glycosyltransferase [Flavobacteriales bacterium]MBK7940894.1 glycosyltransferase [Flavobacteriales bacterium]MBK8948456.1 glycosyltransferase [Flavobacteriales bacterium]MBK9701683.1 glycosyltransferase [Flavobacteriales bacterium]